MNDGLLVQTYMQAYNTDFPDATRKIEKIVSALKEQLYQKGEVFLPNVGTLYYTMNGTYVFEPSTETFFTPHLYGLSDFTLTPLKALKDTEATVTVHPFITKKQKSARTFVPDEYNQYGRTLRRIAHHAVGVAAAILLFCLLSVPVENTYMDDASYASLSAESMFDAIRGRSVATNLLGSADDKQKSAVQRTRNNVNTLKPTTTKTVMVPLESAKPADQKKQGFIRTDSAATIMDKRIQAIEEAVMNISDNKIDSVTTKVNIDPAPTKEEKESVEKGSYIIVASLPTAADAQKQVKVYQSKGYTSARVLEYDKRHRIALYFFKKQEDARKQLNELKKQEAFKGSWIFTL